MPMKYLFLSLVMTVVLAGCGGGGGGVGGGGVEAGGSPVAAEVSSVDNGAAVPVTAPETPPAENVNVTKEVTLAWNESLNEQGEPNAKVTGYKVHYGDKPGAYSAVVTVDKVTTATIAGLNPGNYFFALTAFDAEGNESGYSEEISATI